MQQCHYKVLRGTQGSGVPEHPVASAGMRLKVWSLSSLDKKICWWGIWSRVALLLNFMGMIPNNFASWVAVNWIIVSGITYEPLIEQHTLHKLLIFMLLFCFLWASVVISVFYISYLWREGQHWRSQLKVKIITRSWGLTVSLMKLGDNGGPAPLMHLCSVSVWTTSSV